ncbi:MAG TPA: hypothetical protein VMJ65_28600 [Solirubrobacteraceae bacterium]|nr:hypothetical protein [Solirubrobacteraceae bacterium]
MTRGSLRAPDGERGYHRLHSGWAIALVLLADFLPGIVFGALADRFSQRSLAVDAEV